MQRRGYDFLKAMLCRFRPNGLPGISPPGNSAITGADPVSANVACPSAPLRQRRLLEILRDQLPRAEHKQKSLCLMDIQQYDLYTRLERFDLNLLIALDVLLTERSVTRAALRLNVTQPAMSAALRRLRESFDDELFVANGRQMVPTPHALELAPHVASLIAAARALVSGPVPFDPASSQRTFRIVASDYIGAIVLRPLLAELATSAPNIHFVILTPHSNAGADLERGEVDCIISPEQFLSRGHPQELLLEERHVLLGWKENPLFAGPISKEDYSSAAHVGVELSNSLSFVEEHVRALGDRRRIEVITSSFTAVPWLLPGSGRIALVLERPARLFLDILPLAMAPPPFDIPPMREMIQYNPTRADDEGLFWLRGVLHRHAGMQKLNAATQDLT